MFGQTNSLISAHKRGLNESHSSRRSDYPHPRSDFSCLNKCKERDQSSYITELQDARLARPHFISVVSFNEWGEGSQIEPAKTNSSTSMSGIVSPDKAPFTNFFEYLGYRGTSLNYPNLYLDITDTQIGAGTWSPRVSIPVQ